MSSNANAGGIDFVSSNPSGSKYVVQSGEGNRPVTFVSWYDAARIANWLHNGQGAGSTESGVYTLTGNTSISGGRSANATVVIPTEDEWYKAAYHQPESQGGDSDNYWLYPTGTNTEPHSDNPASLNTPHDTNVGNIFRDDGVANGYNDGYAVTGSTRFPSGNALTDVGAYTLADSFYGTFDQGGNVFEWNETLVSESSRGVRGGSWNVGSLSLRADSRPDSDPSSEGGGIGFRLASIPEPSGMAVIVLGAMGLIRRSRRAELFALYFFYPCVRRAQRGASTPQTNDKQGNGQGSDAYHFRRRERPDQAGKGFPGQKKTPPGGGVFRRGENARVLIASSRPPCKSFLHFSFLVFATQPSNKNWHVQFLNGSVQLLPSLLHRGPCFSGLLMLRRLLVLSFRLWSLT